MESLDISNNRGSWIFHTLKVNNSKFTNVHPPNRFAHKEGIWYDYLCPHKKEEMTRMTSQQEIFKGE
jgi:hypothetical protein